MRHVCYENCGASKVLPSKVLLLKVYSRLAVRLCTAACSAAASIG